MTRRPYYSGPVSDHFDGTRFFIAGAPPDKSRGDMLKFLTRTPRAAWPKHRRNPPAPAVVNTVPGTGLRVTTIGHASHLIQTADLNILVDPVWSQRASPFSFIGPKRVRQPGLALDALPPIDAILITHNHYDHLDIATLQALQTSQARHANGARHAKPACRIIAPLGNDTVIRAAAPTLSVETYDWGDRVALGPNVTAVLTPCHHWSARGLGDRRMALWAAFVIETAGGAIYYVGDTAYRDGKIFSAVRERFGRPRLAVLPIGAYEPRWFMRDQHVDPVESVRVFGACGAHYALGHHWGTFQLTSEAIDDPPHRLAAALAAAGVAPERFRVQDPGQAYDVPLAMDDVLQVEAPAS